MNILIVEDDPFVSRDIVEKLKNIGYSKVAVAHNYDEALLKIKENQPQVVLLDIDLGESKTGIDIGKYLAKIQIPFIYLSDMQDPSTFEAAKQTKPKANLDKPVSNITLRNSLELALPAKSETLTGKHIVVPSGSKKIKIDPNNIVYLKAAKNNCEIHLNGGNPMRYLSSTPMGNVIRILNSPQFCQVHRSYVVNLNQVYAFQGGRVFMDKELHIEIPISPSYLTSFKSKFSAI